MTTIERSAIDPDAVARLVRLAATAADAGHIEVARERLELLRFGGDRITYQHGEDRIQVRLRLVRGRRQAWAQLGSIDPEVVGPAAERLAQMLGVIPDGDPPPMPGPWSLDPTRPTAHDATARVTPHDRAAMLDRIRAAMPRDAELGGSISTSVTDVVVANTAGLLVAERRSRARVQAVARIGDRSTFVQRIDPDWSRIDAEELVAASQRELPPGTAAELPDGPVRALLGPQAVATLLATLAYLGLGAPPPVGPPGPFSDAAPGDAVLSSALTLTDDGLDPAGLPCAFDPDGWAKRRVVLIDHGAFRGQVHDARTALRAAVEPTGHTAPPGWRHGSGPAPTHLLVGAGDSDRSDLVAAVDDGLAIQRVHYVRVVQPREGLVTGTTRDATARVRGGRVEGAVPQVRFTVRLGDLFRVVDVVGRRRERGDAAFMESITAPGVVVPAFPIDAIAHT